MRDADRAIRSEQARASTLLPVDRVQFDNMFISWIGGTVIAEPFEPNGFRFDPATVLVAEVTAEGYQTNICQIAANPGMYDGGLWDIPYFDGGIR